MGGSSKKQTVGYWYRPLYHYGLSKGPVDAFLEMRGGDRVAWRGLLTHSGRIRISQPNLWGGEKSEGGLDGDFDMLFGDAAQAPNDYLAAQLGADQPTYRGKVTGVWRGGRYGAMNPYPKPLSFKLRRILKGWDHDTPWYPEKAAVPIIAPAPMALYFALDLSGSMTTVTANGKSRLQNMKDAIVATLQFIADVVLPANAVIDIMIVGWGSEPSTRSSLLRRHCSKSDIAALQTYVGGLAATMATYFPAGLLDMPAFFAGAPADSLRLVLFLTDGEPSATNVTISPEQIAAAAAALVAAQPGVAVHAINIDLSDTTYTARVDNTPEDGVPVIAGNNPDAITAAILTAFGPLLACNPAHILYDSITAADMQGEPVSLINEASFRAAADKFYKEGFGLCAIYENEEIETFQQRICDVAGACLTQSRVDGQYYLDLIRGDYDRAALPVIGSDDVIEFSQEPSSINEVTNQITVQWFDPQNKENRATPPIQSMGAIMAAGGVIAEIKTYREIPTEYLALRVGARDLIAKATPLSRFDLTTNRRPWRLRPGQYFRLQLPEEGIADMVCLVGDIDVGTLTDGRVRIKAIQDVFSFPDTVYVRSEPGQSVSQDSAPTASLHQAVFEAPYIELVTALSRADFAAFPPDGGILMTVASRPASGLNYSIYSAAEGEALSINGAAEWCPSAQIVEAAGYFDVQFSLVDSNDLHHVAVGSWALWDTEIVRVDALDADAGTVTLGRGCADSVPVKHAAGSRLYFCGDWAGTDGRDYVAGETVTTKLLTRTSADEQPLADAPALTLVMRQRQIRPYPPGRFRINGDIYPTIVNGSFAVFWAHRDRSLQADQLIDTNAVDIGPEPGTTYRLDIFDADTGLLKHSIADIAGTSIVAPASPLRGAGRLRIKLFSVRDGYDSYQAQEALFDWTSGENVMSFSEGYTPPAGDAVTLQFEE